MSCSGAVVLGGRFPAEVIAHAVRLYFRFSLSDRDVEELMLARGGRGVLRDHPAVVCAFQVWNEGSPSRRPWPPDGEAKTREHRAHPHGTRRSPHQVDNTLFCPLVYLPSAEVRTVNTSAPDDRPTTLIHLRQHLRGKAQ
jgi:hypothetical protein